MTLASEGARDLLNVSSSSRESASSRLALNQGTRNVTIAELTLPDDVLVSTGLTESDCLIELAVHLYAQRRITVEHALQISQLSRVELDDAVAKRRCR